MYSYLYSESQVAPKEPYKKKEEKERSKEISAVLKFLPVLQFSAYKAITSVISPYNGDSLSHSLGHPHKNMNNLQQPNHLTVAAA
jgi:hypothetical protein